MNGESPLKMTTKFGTTLSGKILNSTNQQKQIQTKALILKKTSLNSTPTTSRNQSQCKYRTPTLDPQNSKTMRQFTQIESVELVGNGNVLKIKGFLENPEPQEIQSARVRPRIKMRPLDLVGMDVKEIESRGFKTERASKDSRSKKSSLSRPKRLPPINEAVDTTLNQSSRSLSRNKNPDLEGSKSIIKDMIDQLGTLQGHESPSCVKNKALGNRTPSRFKMEAKSNQWTLPTETTDDKFSRTSRAKKDFRERLQNETECSGGLMTERSERGAWSTNNSVLKKKMMKRGDILLSESPTPYGLRSPMLGASNNILEGIEANSGASTTRSIDTLRPSPIPVLDRLRSGQNSSFSKELENLAKIKSPFEHVESTENELFMRKTKTFFKLNPNNKKLQEYRELYEGKELDYAEVYERPMNIHPEVQKGIEEIERARSNPKAISLLFNSGKKLVQPSYMKEMGSMCYTELWGEKESTKAVKQLEKKGASVRLFPKRDADFLFKPEKWEEEAELGRKKAFEIPEAQNLQRLIEEVQGKPDPATKELFDELSHMPILHPKPFESQRDQSLRLHEKRGSAKYNLLFNTQLSQSINDVQDTVQTPLSAEKKTDTFLSRTINKQRKTLVCDPRSSVFALQNPLLLQSQFKEAASPLNIISEDSPESQIPTDTIVTNRSERRKKDTNKTKELINPKDHLTKTQKINNLLQIMAEEQGSTRLSKFRR